MKTNRQNFIDFVNHITKEQVHSLVMGEFLGTTEEEFETFVNQMPANHWAKKDLSAVRLGWEAHKLLEKNNGNN